MIQTITLLPFLILVLIPLVRIINDDLCSLERRNEILKDRIKLFVNYGANDK